MERLIQPVDTGKTKNRQLIIYICAFFIPFLMMQVFWALCGIYPYGPYSILTGDMDIEFVNFYSYFINTLKTNNDWSYMFAKTLGGDFPGLAAFQLHDPLLFILLLFPKENIAFGIEVLLTLQISVAGLSASILLNKRYRASYMSLIFSTGYAFCAFFFGYLVLTIYFGAIAILPIVLYFFLKYIDDGRSPAAFIISAALYIYINYHMGFMLVIFLVILYASRIIKDTSAIKRLPSLALSAVTVLLIDGFVLLRTGLSLLGEKTTTGADYGIYRRFPMNQLFAGMFSGCARNDLRPLIYCGIIPLFFAVFYFVSKKAPIREKIANVFVMASVAVSMWINLLDAVWHGFNNPEGFYWRYAYFISITVIVLGYKGYCSFSDNEEDRGGKRVFISGGILYLYMAWLFISGNEFMDMPRIIINVALIAIVCAAFVFTLKEKRARVVGFSALAVLAVCEMLYSAKISYISLNTTQNKRPQMSAFKEDYHDISDAVTFVKSHDGGMYRIEKDFDRAINDPSMFDYIGLSHNSSCEKDAINDWLVNFGFCKTVYFTYYNGGSTAFVDDFFGVRYYISRFDTIEKPYDHLPYSGKYSVYENKEALPMAYFAPEGLASCDITNGNTFEKQNRIASYWSDRPVFIKADHNAAAEGAETSDGITFKRTGEEGYIVYDIKVTKELPIYFYFYAPDRQNAEVFVNDVSKDVYFTVNHWNILCAGTYKAGDDIRIKLQIKDDELSVTDACFYYEDDEALREWGQAAEAKNTSIGPVDMIRSSHLKFTTDSDKEGTVMMSIPYDDSWTITCDGQKIEPYPAIDILMAYDIPAGSHVIEMKYTPAGTYPGIVLSIIGVLMLVGRIIYIRRKDEG